LPKEFYRDLREVFSVAVKTGGDGDEPLVVWFTITCLDPRHYTGQLELTADGIHWVEVEHYEDDA
jgi:hypothetical protein